MQEYATVYVTMQINACEMVVALTKHCCVAEVREVIPNMVGVYRNEHFLLAKYFVCEVQNESFLRMFLNVMHVAFYYRKS